MRDRASPAGERNGLARISLLPRFISTRREILMMHQLLCRTLAVIVLATAATAVACHHPRTHGGPAERAGRHIDHAADKAGDAIENAGHKVNRALPGD